MSASLCKLLIAIVALLSCNFVDAKLFNSRGGWLKSHTSDRDERRNMIPTCVSLRGGSSEKSADEKIKGYCIGIDLGTTTRYV